MQTWVARLHLRMGLLAVAILLFALPLLAPLVYAYADFSPSNRGWNGTSGFLRDDEAVVTQTGFGAFGKDPAAWGSRAALFVVGPSAPFTPDELAWAREFVHDGGLLVVADDFGTGNTLLAGVGAESRFHGGLLHDIAFAKQPAFAAASSFAPHPLTTNLSLLILNHATPIVVGPGAQALAWTSHASWVREPGAGGVPVHTTGPHPFLAIEPVGAGVIILLADPSLFINDQARRGDGMILLANLRAYAETGRTLLLVDDSHGGTMDVVTLVARSTRAWPEPLRLAVGVALVGVHGLMAHRVLTPRRVPGPTASDHAATAVEGERP